jgi:putative transposase
MAYSRTTLPLQQSNIYHLFSRGVGKDKVFREEKDYGHFLEIAGKKLLPLTEIYAYCLIPNHYHFMLKVLAEPILVSKAIGELGVSYAKWFNIKYSRMGALFMSPFKRIALCSDREIAWIPWYIHRNPMHHGLTNDWANYPWSSYSAYVTGKPTRIHTSFLLDFYGGLPAMIKHHEGNANLWMGEDLES